jgi:hypothetical protein
MIKFHYLDHICDTIRRFGVPRNVSMQMFEHAHKEFVKKHAKYTNHKGDVNEQVAARVTMSHFLHCVVPVLLNRPIPRHGSTEPPKAEHCSLYSILGPLTAQIICGAVVRSRLASAWDSYRTDYKLVPAPFDPAHFVAYKGISLIVHDTFDCPITRGDTICLLQGTPPRVVNSDAARLELGRVVCALHYTPPTAAAPQGPKRMRINDIPEDDSYIVYEPYDQCQGDPGSPATGSFLVPGLVHYARRRVKHGSYRVERISTVAGKLRAMPYMTAKLTDAVLVSVIL